ncbi:MAG: hypothetical protein HYX82_00695 [Chloroflexi bacterium]|nr:hypothetical protein [Chloroflexota bacterium]
MIQETFDANMRLALMANFPSAVDALLELVDNGADDWVGKTQQFPVEVDVVITPHRLRIRSKGEVGMGYGELENFLKWGYAHKTARIGQWGQGGKAAIGYLAHGVRIRCTKRGEEVGWELTDPTWGDRQFFTAYEPQPFPAPKEEAYVDIELFRLKRKVSYRHLIRRLSSVYRPILQNDNLIVTIKAGPKTQRVKPLEISLSKEPQPFEIALPDGKSLRGWLGIMAPVSENGCEGVRGGIRCYRYGRLVSQGEFFGHPGPADNAALNTLTGEVYIDFPVSPNLNKSDFDRESDAWRQIYKAMHLAMEPWVKDILAQSQVVVPEESRENALRALVLIRRAFRRIESGYKGMPLVSGSGQPKEKVEYIPGKEAELQFHDEPASLEEAVQELKQVPQKAGQIYADIVSGDGTLRSVSTHENGTRKVIVFSNYPGYQAARGDMAYLLETLSLEMARPEADDPQDVNEYLDRANSALRIAASDFLRHRI